MKSKFVFKGRIFLFFIFLFCVLSTPLKVNAYSYTNFVYARIETSGVYLYKSANSTGLENAYFELPKSYFVLLVSNIDSNYYKAQYKDVVGYVKKNEVSPVAETPKEPYPKEVKFWVYASDGKEVKSCTFDSNNPKVLGDVAVMQELDYYGEMIGDEFIKGRGFTWLYCKTENFAGYLYKGLCDVSKNFKENQEVVTKISEPFLDKDDSYLYNLVDMSPFLKIVLIMLVTLPCFLLVYLLFKPFNINKKKDKDKNDKPKIKPQENKKKKIRNRTINKIQQIIDDSEL